MQRINKNFTRHLVLLVVGLAVAGGLGFLFVVSFSATVDYQIFLPASASSTQAIFQYGSWPALSNETFFRKARDAFIATGASFIEADLTTMQLRVYQGGAMRKEVPIITKGRVGSWWETPAGLYKVASKERTHFSSFGSVYQPWSLAFQGNFFIHGWPHYPDGTPVESDYSGGCIRLSTHDAEEVYNLVEKGAPVLVFERAFGQDSFQYRARPPQLLASKYLAADLNNNFVFLERGVRDAVPVASITKLVTALVAAEYINLEKEVIVPEAALVETSVPRFRAGDRMTAMGLLYPLLKESSNEAAYALASVLGEQWFVTLMNEKAASLGMQSTRFVDPAGIGEGNVSTAEDLFTLAKYLYHNRSFILRLSAGTLANSPYGAPPYRDLKNFNVFVGDGRFVGGKIGKTPEAQETMLSVFELELNGAMRPVVFIVLGSTDQERDVRTMLGYVENIY